MIDCIYNNINVCNGFVSSVIFGQGKNRNNGVMSTHENYNRTKKRKNLTDLDSSFLTIMFEHEHRKHWTLYFPV